MQQEFDRGRNVYLDRDAQGVVRALRHVDAPYTSRARTPQLAAADYVTSFRDLLDLPASSLDHLGVAPSEDIEEAGTELRYASESQQFDSATVAYSQTSLGLPVFGAGLAVNMKRNEPFRIISSQSTQHTDVNVKRPSAAALKRAKALSADELGHALGLDAPSKGAESAQRLTPEIEARRLVIFQYVADAVQRDGPPRAGQVTPAPGSGGNGKARSEASGVTPEGAMASHAGLPTLPLPPVSTSVQDGQHYVSLRVDFLLSLAPWGRLHWTAILDVETLSVLYLRPHIDNCPTGLVFDVDPMTTNGGPLPSATSAALNPLRVSEALLGLNAPSGGNQSLAGDTVALIDSELPAIAPPTEASGVNFDFDARTDNFSAVNAYVHSDRFFRLVDGMGFSRATYFSGTTFPTSVDHRGSITTTTGIEINAHCVGTTGGAGILRTTFMLADTGDTAHPIGLADDYRVVLHELGGHGVLYNHVSSANFGFSHSAGDSVGAILHDPGTHAPDRFLTFPWVGLVIGRRHDRLPSAGWGWAGNIALNPFNPTYDGGGYNNEQILSTTMFRIYRSLGGDSSDINTQRFAARVTVYLILRAIGTLTPSTNPSSAAGFETALETADAGDWTSENITGGAYRKVIRWSFEKQGLFQPAGTPTPNNNAGAAPAVDLYIDDGRAGEYQYQPVFWENQSMWNRTSPDGGTSHQDPIVNQPNYAYVKLKNRGSQPATGVVVKAYHADPAAGLAYPNDWIPMTTAQLPASDVAPNNGAEVTVGPFSWVPTHVGHECMFMVASATGDASNVDNIAAGDSIPEWRLVPNDNNIGQRNVAPVPGGGTSGLTEEFHGLSFQVMNPLTIAAVAELEASLPPLLERRGWRLEFTSRGGGAFKLQPRESRPVVMRLLEGSTFTKADVEAAAQRTIRVQARVGGIVVGGMSYELDPNLVRPNRPGNGHNGHRPQKGDDDDEPRGLRHRDDLLEDAAEALLRSLSLRSRRIRDVDIRKLVVEIELRDDD